MGEYENKPEGFPDRDKELERELIRKELDKLKIYDFIKFEQTIPFFNTKRRTVIERADQLITDLKALFPLGEWIYGKDGKKYISTGQVTVHIERKDVYIHVAHNNEMVDPISVRIIRNDQLPEELRTHPIEEYQKLRKGKK